MIGQHKEKERESVCKREKEYNTLIFPNHELQDFNHPLQYKKGFFSVLVKSANVDLAKTTNGIIVSTQSQRARERAQHINLPAPDCPDPPEKGNTLTRKFYKFWVHLL